MSTAGGIDRETAVAALEHNLWDMWAAFGRGEGGLLVDEPELLRFETPIPHVPYNSIMRTRLTTDVDATIDDVLDAYRRRQVPLMWVVHPTAQPADLAARLEARGLTEAEVCPGMVAPLDLVPAPGPAPDGIEVEQLRSTARIDFVELVAWRYSLPAEATGPLLSIMEAHGFGDPDCPTRAWVARRDGVIVSKVILHVTGDVAGLYGVATRSEARGLGLAATLTCLAFAEARHLGCTLGILHSTPMATRLYASLGFQHVADFRLFGDPDTLHL